jgi:hypothetical protein
MNLRIMIAKAAENLAVIWIFVSVGYLLVADVYDWPLPEFLNYLADHGADSHTLFVLITAAPSIVLLLLSERLAPHLFYDDDLRRFLKRSRRALRRQRRAG